MSAFQTLHSPCATSLICDLPDRSNTSRSHIATPSSRHSLPIDHGTRGASPGDSPDPPPPTHPGHLRSVPRHWRPLEAPGDPWKPLEAPGSASSQAMHHQSNIRPIGTLLRELRLGELHTNMRTAPCDPFRGHSSPDRKLGSIILFGGRPIQPFCPDPLVPSSRPTST